MSKYILNLSEEEKDFLQKIVAISGKDTQTVKEIFKALLKTIYMSVYADKHKVYIPYICSLDISYFDQSSVSKGILTKVEMQAEASTSLKNEISAIVNGEDAPTLKYVNKKITEVIYKKAGIDVGDN